MRPIRFRFKVFVAVSILFVTAGLIIWPGFGRKRSSYDRNTSSNRPSLSSVPSDQADWSRENVVVAAVLVMACNRPEVSKCVDSLLKYRPSERKFPIIVSQDCGHEETSRAIASYGNKVKHIKQPDLSDINVPANMQNLKGYYKISRHFKWALSQVFDVMGYKTVIVVEDDLIVASDFFEYFTATRWLLDKDPTIWCVSAWNDNGKDGFVKGNDLLYRSDFFPGLGWMLTRSVWAELAPKWPRSFWDDWMREPDQHRERSCIRPEISRTLTFGKKGVSNGQFFDEHLKFIKLNSEFYPFTKKNLSYLIKENYEKEFTSAVYRSPLVSVDYLTSGRVIPAPFVRVQYESGSTFSFLAQKFGIMHDIKAGIPRMAYRGIVTFIFRGIRVYLSPPRRWKGYNYSE